MLVKALLALTFVWLFAPQEPNLGFGRPHLISSDSGLQYVRRGIFDAIERVRTDFKANLHAEKPV